MRGKKGRKCTLSEEISDPIFEISSCSNKILLCPHIATQITNQSINHKHRWTKQCFSGIRYLVGADGGVGEGELNLGAAQLPLDRLLGPLRGLEAGVGGVQLRGELRRPLPQIRNPPLWWDEKPWWGETSRPKRCEIGDGDAYLPEIALRRSRGWMWGGSAGGPSPPWPWSSPASRSVPAMVFPPKLRVFRRVSKWASFQSKPRKYIGPLPSRGYSNVYYFFKKSQSPLTQHTTPTLLKHHFVHLPFVKFDWT